MYCPQCGKNLQSHSFQFCPFCGSNLKVLTFDTNSKITQERKPNAFSGSAQEATSYSIILKDCLNPEGLTRRLEKVLERSFVALRFAMANMPCCIVYKSKVNEMMPIMEAFRKEKSSITIIPGDTIGNLDIHSRMGKKIPASFRDYLNDIPQVLLQGEKIFGVFSAFYGAQKGMLVLGDQNIMFVYFKAGKYAWDIIPYYLAQEVVYANQNNAFEVAFKDGCISEKFVFASTEVYEEAFEQVQQALIFYSKTMQVKRSCPKCGRVVDEDIYFAYTGKTCDQCGHPISRKLIYIA